MEAKERLPFLEIFISRYGPKNPVEMNDKIIRRGKYRGYVFVVTETRSNYCVEFLEKRKCFSSAYNAGRWVEKLGDEQARRDRPMYSSPMVLTTVSDTEMPVDASQFW